MPKAQNCAFAKNLEKTAFVTLDYQCLHLAALILESKRRNFTDAEIIRCIEALDQRRRRRGDHKSADDHEKSKAPDGGIDPKSASAKATAVYLLLSMSHLV